MGVKTRRVPPRAVLVALVLATGARGGDDSPIQRIMGQINTRNQAIGKALRAPDALEAAGRRGLSTGAAALVRLGKEARALTEPAKERKRSQQAWIEKLDDFLRASDGFAGVIANPASSRRQASEAYRALQKTCTNCHSAFREEPE
jgi:cytochrome c556